MTEEQQKELEQIFKAMENSGGRFVIGQVIGTQNNHFGSKEERKESKKELNNELLARAIENCQMYFWAKASYAVVFCICRDVYKMQPNKSAFEKMIEGLQYKKKRSYNCPEGTIANAFSDNPIFNENVYDWEKFNALERIIKLRDELLRELKL